MKTWRIPEYSVSQGITEKEFQHQVDVPTVRTSGLPPAKGIVESQVDVDDIYATLGDGV